MKYKVPFVNYPLQYKLLEREIDKTIKDVLQRGDLILRKDVERFEKTLAKFIGTKYAVGLNSCTDALFLSLKAVGIGKGDEVITVSHTFIAPISAIFHCGAKPILIDVGNDFLIDIDKIEGAITPKTKAIIPVHLNGKVCEMDKIIKLAKKYNLCVIEDAAQALGAKGIGKGTTACFSFYPAKVLGCYGDGGAITTNNKEIADKVRLMRNHYQGRGEFGWNSRLDNLQAAILNVKFKYLPKWIKRRKEIAKIYYKGLLKLQIELPESDTFQNYVIRAEKRDELFKYLEEKGVETLIKDPIPNHLLEGLDIDEFNLPYTEFLAKEVISLPMYPELTNQQVKYIIKQIIKFYE